MYIGTLSFFLVAILKTTQNGGWTAKILSVNILILNQEGGGGRPMNNTGPLPEGS